MGQTLKRGKGLRASRPGTEIASLSAWGREPFRTVALVGSGFYLGVMRAMVEGFVPAGCVLPGAEIVGLNGPIGCMRQDLRVRLTASVHP